MTTTTEETTEQKAPCAPTPLEVKAGENPEGSKLTDGERLRLLRMVMAVRVAERERDLPSFRALRDTATAFLAQRGMQARTFIDLLEIVQDEVDLVDKIAVHGELAPAVGREQKR